LFEEGLEKRQQLMAALDAINGRFGRFTAVPALQGSKREWRMHADMKSPAHTTRSGRASVSNAQSMSAAGACERSTDGS